MCTDAKIDTNGRRLTNHSGKVRCATQLYETGIFDEQTMARTGHRSTAVHNYKRPSNALLQKVSYALQSPMLGKEDVATSDEEIVAKKKCVAGEDKQEICSNSKPVEVTFKHGALVLHFKF